MMYAVTGEYEDFNGHENNKNFYLNPDKSLDTLEVPIKWEGIVDGRKVEFIQIDIISDSVDCFDWKGFPSELEKSKIHIVDAIEKKWSKWG